MLVHPDKSESMLIFSKQKRHNFFRYKCNIFVNNNPLNQVAKRKLLGIVIDQNLLWTDHVTHLIKQISNYVSNYHKLKHFLRKNLGKHAGTIFEDLQIIPFHVRVDFKTCLLMHKVFNDLAPPILKFLFKFQCLRLARAVVPSAKSDLFKTSFHFIIQSDGVWTLNKLL